VSQRILIVDDDTRLAQMLATYLEQRGFRIDVCASLGLGRAALAQNRYDALILDVMLPDGEGFDLVRELRPADPIAIVMLTARGEELDRIVGLELGADDYLPKPFNPRELLARINAVLRRQSPQRAATQEVRQFGRLQIDIAARVVRVDGAAVRLTSHQFNLLVALAERQGRVLSREQIMAAIREDPLQAFDRSIDVHISRIRAAIELDPKNPTCILTVRGAGYVFTGQTSPP